MNRGAQPAVGDVRKAVLALELEGDRLDQRIFLVRVLDLCANGLDELEEVFGLELLVVDQQQVGEDLLIALMQFVEVQAVAPDRAGMAPKDTA